jgi:hypothetical protein
VFWLTAPWRFDPSPYSNKKAFQFGKAFLLILKQDQKNDLLKRPNGANMRLNLVFIIEIQFAIVEIQ